MSEDKSPTIVLTGGGTGGHITPILAVAHELKSQNPKAKVVYIGERGGKFDELTSDHSAIDQTFAVSAGKLRRYHGESWFRRLFDVKTNLLNLRDSFRFLRGIFQAWRLLGKIKPNIVFQKGGFVGVPVGLAAAMRHIPIVTHDSDAVPGLANRMVSRWASVHATALAAEYYPYPSAKVLPVGVLVEHSYQLVTEDIQQQFKTRLGLPPSAPLLLVTGGSSGAERINKAVVEIVDELLAKHPDLRIIHQAGKGKTGVYGDYKHERLQVLEFLNPMYEYMGAADLVVCRASANTLAELGVQGKATIAIPSEFLTGGHQIKNARILEEQGAAAVVYEDKLYDLQQGLLSTIESLLADKTKRETLAKTLNAQTIPDAARRLAVLLLEQAKT
jgi:UDP-N-acetylglucosamine--N-acetylmuramyl-(pentapeptide) pyrophosphoryl-undecaprenol N-acetylglucosamine transferase